MPSLRVLLLGILLLDLCACQRPNALLTTPVEAGRKAADGVPELDRPDFIDGFQNGAVMVQLALRKGRKPYLIRADSRSAAPRLLSALPDGVELAYVPLGPEVDLATGLQVRGPVGEPGGAFARGQEAGFQWALTGFTKELSSQGLLLARTLPHAPTDWSKWPEQDDRVQLTSSAISGTVTWFPGGLAWETEVGGFPAQRRWRAFPGAMKPDYGSLAADALWLELREQGAVALDLESGAVLQTLPAQGHDQPVGYDSDGEYLAAERRKLKEPSQVAKMAELRQRAAQGIPQAMYELARALVVSDQEFDGLCPRIVWILEAARRGQVQAMLDAAGFYYGGLGVPQDLAEARRWLDLAVATGSEDARVAKAVMFPPQN